MKADKQAREHSERRPPPGFNVISLLLLLVGILCSLADFLTHDGPHLAIWPWIIWLVDSILGLLCAIAAINRRERLGFLSACGLILNGMAAILTISH